MSKISDAGLAISQAGVSKIESLSQENERLRAEVAHLRSEILRYKQGISDARGRIAQRGKHYRTLYEQIGAQAVVYASGVDAELRKISAFLKQVEEGGK